MKIILVQLKKFKLNYQELLFKIKFHISKVLEFLHSLKTSARGARAACHFSSFASNLDAGNGNLGLVNGNLGAMKRAN